MSSGKGSRTSPGIHGLQRKLDTFLTLRRAVALVWESAPGWTVAGSVLVVLQGVLPLVSLYLLKLIIDAVNAAITANVMQEAFIPVMVLIALLCGTSLAIVVTRSLSMHVSEVQSALTTDHVQDVMHAKSVEVDLEYYENPAYYDTFYRAQMEAPVRPTRIVNGLVQVGQSTVTLAAIAVILISFSWLLAVVLLLAVIPVAFVRWKYADRLYSWRRSRTSKERRSWYYHWMLTNDSHAKEIRLFNLGPQFKGRYKNLRRDLRREYLDISVKRVGADLAAQSLAVLGLFIALAVVVYKAVQGSISVGDLVFYFGIIQQSQAFMNTLLTGVAGLYEDAIFLTSLYEFLDITPGVREPESPKTFPAPVQGEIRFDHVSFRYPGSEQAALSDISLTIPRGRTVALVGENGSGKTTLVKLLCRLYDPADGRITVDGTDLREFSTLDLRREISIVFQDYARYNLTARENIIFGSGDRPTGDDDLFRAAESSGANQVIGRLEQQYETVLGKMFEDGVDLSIGEWQKVALARAFIRDAQLVIMDEPTSALDPMAEAEVISQLRRLSEGRTTIIISHRLSSVKMADCIYFMEKGRIIEQGTHDQLVAASGRYALLFDTQAKQYR